MTEKDDLKALNEKFEIMMRRLDYLEAVLTENKQYPELAQVMGGLRIGTALYREPLKLIERLIGVRRYLEKTPESRDEVSRIILNVLAIKGPMNISALTREVADEKGSSSRVTVRKRLLTLVDEGILVRGDDKKYKFVK
ncbi:hypothetical protein E2P71_11045 [Candidatus Bathyarchaeota archaeon]|nr:hypothetical protein E2P71_11045 [Candidatus Bathyarchaeota archaeon]